MAASAAALFKPLPRQPSGTDYKAKHTRCEGELQKLEEEIGEFMRQVSAAQEEKAKFAAETAASIQAFAKAIAKQSKELLAKLKIEQ